MAVAAEAVGLEPFTSDHFVEWASELVLDTGEQWEIRDFQRAFVEDVFGPWKVYWLVIPEGNGKSTLIAGIGLYFLEFLPGASIPVAARSREQAEIIYKQAEKFVTATPRLHKLVPDPLRVIKGRREREVPRFACFNGFRQIRHFGGGVMQIRAAEESAQDGIIPKGCGFIDELHRFPELGLYRLWGGKGIKHGSKLIVISTAGEPGGAFEELREEIRQRCSDVTREETFVRAAGKAVVLHEWAVPEDGDVEDLELVARANPLLTLEQIREKRDTEDFDPLHWRRFTCNLPTRGGAAAITESEWFGAVTKTEIPKRQQVWVGLDVGWKDDTTAIVPLWWKSDKQRILGPATILIPPRDGSSLHPDVVERALVEIHERNPIEYVVMDTHQAEWLQHWISDNLKAIVVDRDQNNSRAVQDYQRFMEALRQGWLWHSGDPGLTRHAMNAHARILPFGDTCFVRPVQSRRAPDRQDTRVIDALVAAAMVHSVAHETLLNPKKPPRLVSW
jgi:phage terminase large subunit-like protein